MQFSFTGVNLNRTLIYRQDILRWCTCGEVICSDNYRHPIFTKYSLYSLAISSGLVTARLPMKN